MAPPSSKKTKIPASSPPSSSSSRVPATEEAQSPRSSIDDERSEDEEESTFVSDLVFASVPDSEFTPWVIKQIQRHLATRGSSQQDDSGSLQGSVLSRSTSSTPHGGNEHWRQEGRKQEFTFELKKRRECETGVIMSTWNLLNSSNEVMYEDEEWVTVEYSGMKIRTPPSNPLQLFDGIHGYFYKQLNDYKDQFNPHQQTREFQDLFRTFGGTVLEEKEDIRVDCYFGKKSFKGMNTNLCNVHVHWIALSVQHGLLLPVSLFDLESTTPSHPITNVRSAESDLDGLLNRQRPDCELDHETILLLGASSSPVPIYVSPAFEGRKICFERLLDRTCFVRRGMWMRVVLNATKGAVERLGATVVDRVEKADWLVVDTRESLAFSKAISRPGFVVGTLAHLFAQIRSESDSILDPYRNVLHFPTFPTDVFSNVLASDDVYVDSKYPEEYRTHLRTVIEIIGGNYMEFDDDDDSPCGTVGHLVSDCLRGSYNHFCPNCSEIEVIIPEDLEMILAIGKITNLQNVPSTAPSSSRGPRWAKPSRVSPEVKAIRTDIERRWESHDSHWGKSVDLCCPNSRG